MLPQRRRVRIVTILAFAVVAVLLAAPQAFAAKGIILGTSGSGGGKLMDGRTGQTITFYQPYLKELGIRVGSEVTFEIVFPFGPTDPVAVLVQRQGPSPLRADKGKIIIIRDDGGGIVEDGKTGREFTFEQPFSGELGLTDGDLVSFAVLPGSSGAVLLSLVNTSRSNIRGIVLSLGAGDATDVLSVEGGDRVPVERWENPAPFSYVRTVTGEMNAPLAIELPFRLSETLSGWIQATLSGKTERKSGSVIYLDRAGQEVLRYEFSDALIGEVSFPAVDANAVAGKTSPGIVIKLTAPVLHFRAQPGRDLQPGDRVDADRKPQKLWMANAFRVASGPGSRTVVVADLDRDGALDPVVFRSRISGSTNDYSRAVDPSPLEPPAIAVRGLIEAGPFEEGVQARKAGKEVPVSIVVEYLSDTGKVLARLTLGLAVTSASRDSGTGALRVAGRLSGDGAKIDVVIRKF